MQHAKARMDHLPAEKPRAHFTECAHARARLKRFGLTPVEIKKAQHQLTRGILDPGNQLAPGPIGDLSRAHGAFHLGAQAHVGESWHRPFETVMINTVGTLNLLQSIVDCGLELEKFDTAGTSEEYGNVRENVAHHHDFDDLGSLILHERSPINPKSIYATAKVAADFLTMNYFDAFGLPGVVTRMFNNYGPRQNPEGEAGVIAIFCDRLLSGRPLLINGDGLQTRDFVHVSDVVRANLLAATAKDAPGEIGRASCRERVSRCV